jgi:sulfofructose kinase
MRPGEVICVGMTNVDHVLEVDEIPTRPVKVPALRRVMRGGGQASTAAVACAALGTPVQFWGRVGRDAEAAFLRGRLSGHGVGIDALLEVAAGTVVAVVLVDRHGERMIVGHGVRDLPGSIERLPLERIGAAGAVLADSSWPQAALAVLAEARARGVPSVLDGEEVHPRELPEMARRASLPVLSEGAARLLAGGADDLAHGLRDVLPGDFGVTLGARGSLWRIAGAIVEIPALPVASVDSTGAGDVFHGALAAALAEGMPLLAAARFATACAGLKCAAGDGWDGMPTRPQVEQALRRL